MAQSDTWYWSQPIRDPVTCNVSCGWKSECWSQGFFELGTLILTICLSDCIIVFVSTDASVQRAKHVYGQTTTCQSVPMCIGATLTRQIMGTTKNHKCPEAFILTFPFLLSAKKRRIYCTSREGVRVTQAKSHDCASITSHLSSYLHRCQH